MKTTICKMRLCFTDQFKSYDFIESREQKLNEKNIHNVILPLVMMIEHCAYSAVALQHQLLQGTTTEQQEHLQASIPYPSDNHKHLTKHLSLPDFESCSPSYMKIIAGFRQMMPSYYAKRLAAAVAVAIVGLVLRLIVVGDVDSICADDVKFADRQTLCHPATIPHLLARSKLYDAAPTFQLYKPLQLINTKNSALI